MPVGLMDSPTPLSAWLVHGIYRGTIKVRDVCESRCYLGAEQLKISFPATQSLSVCVFSSARHGVSGM